AWIGGTALQSLFSALIPGWNKLLGPEFGGHTVSAWLSFLIFWCLNITIVYRGMDVVRKLAGLAAPFVFVMTAALTVWAVNSAQGLGHILAQPGKLANLAQFMPVFIPSLSAMIGFWATLSLNMPDFTRFGRSQREQVLGQVVALPLAMTTYAGMGVLITSAAILIFPGVPMSELWDPVKLVGQFDNRLFVAVSMFTIAVATLCVNIAANVVSPANDFANAFPKLISFRTGGLITGFIGILMQPWRLLADASAYIFSWLQGYSGGLGSIAGVLIVDYWILRKCKLDLPALYQAEGAYRFAGGWNPHAVLATFAGCLAAWIGLFVKPLAFLYEYAWFVGFGVSALVYYLLMRFCARGSAPVSSAG
ncbi:MAG: cytosine permease, partial [Candidatus Obscuribacterales bacterium]|nr:cytosine permease [Candidatus Obscuribacterales bacterium]